MKIGDIVKVKETGKQAIIVEVENNLSYSTLSYNTYYVHTIGTRQLEWYDADELEELDFAFNDEEKALLRHIPEKYKWLVRGNTGNLRFYVERPTKCKGEWEQAENDNTEFAIIDGNLLPDMFDNIQFTKDAVPCEFRKFL